MSLALTAIVAQKDPERRSRFALDDALNGPSRHLGLVESDDLPCVATKSPRPEENVQQASVRSHRVTASSQTTTRGDCSMGLMEIWTYRETTWSTEKLVGFSVEALDGGIGKIDEATNEVGASYIVVDTGPWIFGKKVMLPAGVINRVDREEETVYADRTKDQIKNAPEFDPDDYRSERYRGEVGSYYDRGGAGWRDQ